MARAHYADTLLGTSGTGVLSLLSGASVLVCNQGTTTPITATLHDADTGGSTLANPLTTDTHGLVEFWLDDAARVTLVVTKTGYTSQTRTVDVEDAPGAGGGGGAVTQVYTNAPDGCNGTIESLALPEPESTVRHRTIFVQLLDPDPDTVELALGANDGNQSVTSNFTPGVVQNIQIEVFFANTSSPGAIWRAKNDHGAGPASGGLGWFGTTLEWTLWCFSGTAPGFVGVPFPAGSIVEVWDWSA